jgi:hypothetical protein
MPIDSLIVGWWLFFELFNRWDFMRCFFLKKILNSIRKRFFLDQDVKEIREVASDKMANKGYQVIKLVKEASELQLVDLPVVAPNKGQLRLYA